MERILPKKEKSPVKAIRAYCMDCCNNQPKEIKLCPAKTCALHDFRFGLNPFVKRPAMSDEQKQLHAEVLRRARASRINSKCDTSVPGV